MPEQAAEQAGRASGDSRLRLPLVTGGSGFAGQHLAAALAERGSAPAAPSSAELDLCDRAAVEAAVGDVAPTSVFHLAAFSSPNRSWERPRDALVTNLEMTLNLLEAIRIHAPDATVVLVGSGQVYGEPDALPVTESAPLEPGNPYAVSKAACDLLGRQYAEAFDMRVVRLRPFNHAGPGQSEEYVVSSIVRQVAAAEAAGEDELLLRTGNPEACRDFTDVRDVVRAYVLAAELDGGAFNVCSGRSTRVAEVIELVTRLARVEVRHEVDPALLREHDARVTRGSHAALTEATGWEPELSLERTVADTLAWWRERLSS